MLGAEMAAELGRRLHLFEEDSETIQLLVLKHLRMAHVAFRENLDDESVLVGFAVEIGSSETLTMLYLLTCADIASVGPGVLNDWKVRLLTDLYERTMRQLGGSEFSLNERVQAKRDEVLRRVKDDSERDAWRELVDSLPTGFLYGRPTDVVFEDLERLRELPADAVSAWGRFDESRKAVEYSIAAHEDRIDGIFHRLAGALSSKRNQILSADINTLANRLVLDRFYVEDLNFAQEPPESRLEEVSAALVEAVNSNTPPTFKRVWTSGRRDKFASAMPTRVRIDNSTSRSHTIINVFAYDRVGLLYSISRAIYELGLSVHFAKIGTYIDQVVDVFYVSDRDGAKVTAPERLSAIRERLLEAAEDAPKK